MPELSVPAWGVVLTPRGIVVARRRSIATGSSKYDMSGSLPSPFRNMTICSSINTLRISTLNSDYDLICTAAQSRGVEMKSHSSSGSGGLSHAHLQYMALGSNS